jgi:phospholipid/cholesterol/gamma-HCH transport system permease protein
MTLPRESEAEVRRGPSEADREVLIVEGRLDAGSTVELWDRSVELVGSTGAKPLAIDASNLAYCDAVGAVLLVELAQRKRDQGAEVEMRGLREEIRSLVDLVTPDPEAAPRLAREGGIERLGRAALDELADIRALVAFVGELCVTLVAVALDPRRLRGKDVIAVAERAGLGAVGIVSLIGFLLGLILSFQSAIPMQRFGAQIFVADLLGISMLRELGPLMAAVMLTARSGSAFAAEIGTMKVNEELDALSTMGLDPVRFLVVPRVLAAILVIPTLTMIMNVAGLAGGALVMMSLGFPTVTYVNRVVEAVTVGDLVQGLSKGVVFGVIVAAIGSLRGTQTGAGASAVGDATTSAVVSGIVLIAIVDGLFAVAFYVMGI